MDDYEFEQAVDAAGKHLPAELFAAFHTLAFELEAHRGRWGVFFLLFSHRAAMHEVSQAIRAFYGAVEIVDALQFTEWVDLDEALTAASMRSPCIEIGNLDEWLDAYPDEEAATRKMRAWNINRNGHAKDVQVPVLCWLRAPRISMLATTAPDLWSWRAGLYDFSYQPETAKETPLPILEAHIGEFDNRTYAQRTQRVRELEQYLAQEGQNIGLALRTNLLAELGDLYLNMGVYQQALDVLRLRLLPMLTDEKSKASALGRIVQVLSAQGKFDEALDVILTDLLPTVEDLKDMYFLAMTKSALADIYQLHGQLDDALQLLSGEILPIFEKLGDMRSYALTLARIAQALTKKGELEKALRLLQEEVLPALQKLNDLKQCANVFGNIADIFTARGQYQDAIHISQIEQLPIYEKLGDIRSRAVTKGKIAANLVNLGDMDAAIEIMENEELPTYEKSDNVRQLLVGRANLAIAYIKRAQPGDFIKARQLLTIALDAARQMKIPEEERIQNLLTELAQIEAASPTNTTA